MTDITIIPAIDMKGGRCVRLRQGRAENETVYSDDPLAVARDWEAQGAEFLHLVDLDGAFQGKPVHDGVILEIARTLQIPVEIGGGLRTREQIRRYIDGGVRRVILGTRACESLDELKSLTAEFGDGIVVGIDARDGRVLVKGWVESSGIESLELARRVEACGVKTIIYTDISRDGMMKGVNADAMAAMCAAVSCNVIASGGVSSVADVKRLRKLDCGNLTGAIVGKALYDKTVTLSELIEASGRRIKS
ncbi:MAG TPA: 1-(5-phosphoribosyl)-5-[(5-phosphoribosylamino)methylideneamino]imidazole-4-carboxamide isomerase [Kiritimatiellia bacterium]|nr:1-(5-phosphoribosyl)-5-[(5-phosphoribosylamino)methylideneamino]imidazole-4-carboxamide isomerase [Kiritimatiellia bacterium]